VVAITIWNNQGWRREELGTLRAPRVKKISKQTEQDHKQNKKNKSTDPLRGSRVSILSTRRQTNRQHQANRHENKLEIVVVVDLRRGKERERRKRGGQKTLKGFI
jgi:hypothetical protein